MSQPIPGESGPVSGGLKLKLKPEKTHYNQGEIPVIDAIFTNISENPLTICTYLAKHRLLTSMMGGDYEVYPFTPTKKRPITINDFKTLKPGESFKVKLDVVNEPDYEFVYAGHLPPSVPRDMAIKGFPAGKYRFKAHFGSHVSFFDAPEGTYNHAKDRKKILTEVPVSGVKMDPSNVWDGELSNTVDVNFI